MRFVAVTDARIVQFPFVKTHVRNTRRVSQVEVVRETLVGVTQGSQVHRIARP